METFISAISKKEFPISEKISGHLIPDALLFLIREQFPDYDESQFMSVEELNSFREQYISKYLMLGKNTFSSLETKVVDALNDDISLVSAVEDEVEKRTYGQKIADKVASFGGSWAFIISFLVFIVIWICINIFIYTRNEFDPYPFILLNLILSCIAALQAPVIMMSQNRKEQKDRERSKKDYMINLKAELEIRLMHEKIDHLLVHQQEELVQIQKVQMELLEDILSQVKK